MPVAAVARPARSLIAPGDHTLLLVDLQPQMTLSVGSIAIKALLENIAIVANAARGFGTKTIITTFSAGAFGGPAIGEVVAALPSVEAIDRTTLNAWEDETVIAQVNCMDLDRVVVAGLWSSVGVLGPVLSAIDQGFEVYVIVDACADTSRASHAAALARMQQAGARSMTALQYLLELQRDWTRTDTLDLTTAILRAHGGAPGIGLGHANAMSTKEGDSASSAFD